MLAQIANQRGREALALSTNSDDSTKNNTSRLVSRPIMMSRAQLHDRVRKSANIAIGAVDSCRNVLCRLHNFFDLIVVCSQNESMKTRII